MLIIKKLIFAIPFLISIVAFFTQAEIISKDVSMLFSFDINLLYQLIFFALIITATSYFFIIFTTLASDWKIVLPVSLIASASTTLFFPAPINYILGIGLFLCFCITFAFLYRKLSKDPTNFSTSNYIIKPSGQLTGLLVLVTSVIIYMSVTSSTGQVVEKIIDSVVNLSLEFVKKQQLTSQTTDNTQNSLPLSFDQVDLLKQYPDLLKQYGVNPAILNQLNTTKEGVPITPQSLVVEATEEVKPLLTKQITDLIQPYLPFIPFLIAFIFFLNFQFFTSIISLLFSPPIYLLFYILEKSEFVTFAKEMREVKKLVV